MRLAQDSGSGFLGTHSSSALAGARSRSLLIITLVVSALLMAGCDSPAAVGIDGHASLVLSPASASLNEGHSLEVQVVSGAKSGAVGPASSFSWQSSNPAIATVQNGRVTAKGLGEATITATTPSGAFARGSIRVTRSAEEIVVSRGDRQESVVGLPLEEALEVRVLSGVGNPVSGATMEFVVEEGGGSVSTGVTRTDDDGVARTFWELGPIAGHQRIAVRPHGRPELSAYITAVARPDVAEQIEVRPQGVTLERGAQFTFTVILEDRFGNAVGAAPVTWESDDPEVAKVDQSGRVVSLRGGETTISATLTEGSASAGGGPAKSPGKGKGRALGRVTVEDTGDTSAPGATMNIISGDGQQGVVGEELPERLELWILDASGQPIRNRDVSWAVTSGGGRVVDASSKTNGQGRATAGWVMGTEAGSGTLDARVQGVGGVTFHAMGKAGPLSSVAVTPVSAAVAVGKDQTFDIIATDIHGNRLQPSTAPVWSVEDPGVASILTTGKATGKEAGATRVLATVAGVEGAAMLHVNATAEDGDEGSGSRTITVSPDSAEVPVGSTVKLDAIERWPDGSVNKDAEITWTSSNVKVATVDAQGRVAGIAPGKTTISASRAGRSGSATVRVHTGSSGSDGSGAQAVVSSITLSPGSSSLTVGQSLQLQAVVKDQNGNEIKADQLAWATSNGSIAAVDGNGTGASVFALAAGSATVTASAGDVTGSSTLTTTPSSAPGGPIPAFPGAEGWGATALNECRSLPIQVLNVTNRNSSGAGSLDQAIQDIRNDRFSFIIFRTGGHIRMPAGGTRLNGSCVYLAGQTAPGDGIVLEGDGTALWFRGGGGNIHDIVMRHVRFRGRSGRTRNNLIIAKGDRIVLDHMSFSWTDNMLLTFNRYIGSSWSSPISNVSVQNSLMSEAFAVHPTATNFSTNDAGKEVDVIGMSNISFHRNLLAHNSHRNPNTGADNILLANNVLYNWYQGTMQMSRRGHADFVNNFGKAGPMTQGDSRHMIQPNCNSSGGAFSIFAQGNLGPLSDDPSADNWTGNGRQIACYRNTGDFRGQEVPGEWRRNHSQNWGSTPFPIQIRTANNAFDAVLNDVGANGGLTCDGRWTNRQDGVDARVIGEVRNGTGTSSRPANEGAVGGYPSYSTGSACADSDGDGLPDAWEQRYFGSPTGANAAVMGRNGYLVIEHYLNGTTP